MIRFWYQVFLLQSLLWLSEWSHFVIHSDKLFDYIHHFLVVEVITFRYSSWLVSGLHHYCCSPSDQNLVVITIGFIDYINLIVVSVIISWYSFWLVFLLHCIYCSQSDRTAVLEVMTFYHSIHLNFDYITFIVVKMIRLLYSFWLVLSDYIPLMVFKLITFWWSLWLVFFSLQYYNCSQSDQIAVFILTSFFFTFFVL